MAQSRPNTLVGLADAYRNCKAASAAPIINLMGIVVDVLPPTTNNTTGDWQITFTVQDSDMMKIPNMTKGLKARFFTQNKEELPPTLSVGDIVLIRSCKVIAVRGQPIIANVKRLTSTIVYQAASIPEPGFKQSFLGEKDIPSLPQDPNPRPSKAEQMYAITLKQLAPSVVNTAGLSDAVSIATRPAADRAGRPPQTNTKFRLIQNVNYNDYCDLAVEVVKKFPNSNGNMELYVTDYTANNSLYDYPAPGDADADEDFSRDGDYYDYISNVTGKRKNWSGPSGRRTMQVELLPPHAGYARDRIREGDFVKLLNVRIKHSSAGKMEGNLWPDRQFPDKILVQPLKEVKQLRTLVDRREDYWRDRTAEVEAKNQAEKTERQEKKLAKKQRKKENKARKLGLNTDEMASASAAVVCNTHVSCVNYDGVKISTLRDVQSRDHSYTGRSGVKLELPYLNVKHKVKVRVVDFWPPMLEDFASPAPAAISSGEHSDDDTNTVSPYPSQKWIWDFFLLLEDIKPNQPGSAPAQLWAHVDHTYAEFLLCMDEDATDLRRDLRTLAKLREQLAILWGNLEELKAAALVKQQSFPALEAVPAEGPSLSNLPFSCFIAEYGQRLDQDDIESAESSGYITLYDMSGARIFQE
ncbi:hypothetical protein QM012_006758 [Aureobasidium pullulans]|uniref:Protection of telomeres protein 1 n=1 Tax=Aureobasidium pullulans TaxID=5580 RepID=A0ABR0TPG3_AURPU